MFDLKVINSVLDQLEEDRGISREKVIEAIEFALASAYKKEYGKKGQIVKAKFDLNTGGVEFSQSKIVVDKDQVIIVDHSEDTDGATQETHEVEEVDPENPKVRYNPEHHIFLEEARLVKSGAQIGDEIIFQLAKKDNFGRIAAQTAKQVITQKIREAEKVSVLSEYGEYEGTIVSGTVERSERGAIYLDMGRAVGFLPYEEQIPGEHFKQGERVRAYLFKVEESARGVFLKLSRSHPKFLEELFKAEVPELAQDIVEVKAVAREAGSRSKIAVFSKDDHIDPVGSLVGQRGVRVSTIMSELGGEKIDIIEWNEDIKEFIEDSLSPAAVTSVEIVDEENKRAKILVAEDQQSLAIGKGGQNVRLAAKLTGWKIDIASIDANGEEIAKETKEDREARMEKERAAIQKEQAEVETEEDAVVEETPSDVPSEEEVSKETTPEDVSAVALAKEKDEVKKEG